MSRKKAKLKVNGKELELNVYSPSLGIDENGRHEDKHLVHFQSGGRGKSSKVRFSHLKCEKEPHEVHRAKRQKLFLLLNRFLLQ